ncbi:MAG: hypothetical protein ISR65_08085 [Bacteriovoracaceae bacterium]|nr:hypothetical protein [Bacteriovoracaceae bacterium]
MACANTNKLYEVPIDIKKVDEQVWNIIPVIETINSSIPDELLSELKAKSLQDKMKGVSVTYPQQVVEVVGGQKKWMDVEYTTRIINKPYEKFLSTIPAAKWGRYLFDLVGRGVGLRTYDESSGKVVRQVERMILGGTLFNLDMTKVEVIIYEKDRTVVYWRVIDSKNHTTMADIGNLEFKKLDDYSTQVTFHSAHILAIPFLFFGIRLPHTDGLREKIGNAFLKHLDNYHRIVSEH